MGNFIDKTGKRFGRLIVIERSGSDKWGNSMWLCRCDCGTEKVIRGEKLNSGQTKSCGCLMRELIGRKLPFGLANMRARIRAYKKRAKAGRLKYDLTEEQFAKMTQKDCYYCGAKPNNISKDPKSNGEYIYNGIDRIDNTKGYTIDNIIPCCWACNQAKSNKSLSEFKNWIVNVYNVSIKGENNAK